VNRISIRGLPLRPGEEHRATIELALEPFSFGGETYAAVPPRTQAELVVQRAASGDVFQLSFATALEGPCMRCLAPALVPIEVDAREYEATDPGADEELRSEYVADGELDASAWARDQVAFAAPAQILCRPDCAGLCPVCGKDLNAEPHMHDEEAVDPRWAALEALRGDEAQ
jgi:uncharacterized protein